MHGKVDLTLVRWARWDQKDLFICVSTTIFVVSKIVQIENKEEEEAKEEIVTQTMMIQHFESDSRLEINRNLITLGTSGTKTKKR